MDLQRLTARIKAKESCSLQIYRDTENVPTIGYGHAIRGDLANWKYGITQTKAELILQDDIKAAVQQASIFPWFHDLDDVRQNVVIEMVFNLGLAGFKGFKSAILAMSRRNYTAAAAHMLDSNWAHQVKGRARELAKMMSTGEWL